MAQGLPPEPPAAPDAAKPATPPAEGTAPAAANQFVAPELPVSPGPLEAERKKLLDTINAAKQYGFGTTAYLNAYQALDDRVKAGAPEPEIKGRLDSIVSGLDEQLKRSKQLKTQRPAPPIAASSPPPSAMGGSGGPGGLNIGGGGGNTDQLINKLKDKWFGGEIPDSIKKKIPAGIDPSMLNSDTARELMKKYGKQ